MFFLVVRKRRANPVQKWCHRQCFACPGEGSFRQVRTRKKSTQLLAFGPNRQKHGFLIAERKEKRCKKTKKKRSEYRMRCLGLRLRSWQTLWQRACRIGIKYCRLDLNCAVFFTLSLVPSKNQGHSMFVFTLSVRLNCQQQEYFFIEVFFSFFIISTF